MIERIPGFFSKFSLKTKMIIFVVLSIIVLGIAINENLNTKKIREEANQKSTIENTQISTEDPKKNEEALNKAKEEEQKKQKEEAQKKLEDRYMEGYKAFHSQKYQEAVDIENEVINQDNSFYKAYSVKGIALCYSKRYNEGMENIDKGLQLKPDYGYGRFNKALALELYAHYDEALKWYDKSLEIENYIWSYYGKASIYGRRGDVANTVKYLKIAVDMDASVKAIAKDEHDFDNIRQSKEFQELLK